MANIVRIDALYFAKATLLNWRKRVARRNGRNDEANDYEVLAWDAERIGLRIRAQGERPWPQPGLDEFNRQRQASLQGSLAS